MPNTHETLTSLFSDIADAIREKTGDTADIVADEFPTAIAEISGGDGGAYDITATDNGDGTQTIDIVDASGGGGGGFVLETEIGNMSQIVDVVGSGTVTNSFAQDVNLVRGTAVIDATGTTLSCSVYAKAGDWVLATVSTRSATTYPSGWTLLHESPSLGSGGSNQRMAFLCKQADADGNITFSVTQTDNARIYINLIDALCDGFAYHAGTETINYDSTATIGTVTIARPDYDFIIWGCTTNIWKSGAPYGTWHCDELTPICLSDVQSRQANFCDYDSSVANRNFTGYGDDAYGCYVIDCVEMFFNVDYLHKFQISELRYNGATILGPIVSGGTGAVIKTYGESHAESEIDFDGMFTSSAMEYTEV